MGAFFAFAQGVAGERRRRRTFAAMVAGAALFLAGAVATIGGFATAIGGYSPMKPLQLAPEFSPTEETPAPEVHSKRSSHAAGRAVCVRLCDGFFFPTSSKQGGDAACAAQCPDAPVAMYSEPGDRIEDAVSLTGARYSALPVALENRTTFDDSCTCHRTIDHSRAAELLRDPTLRKGDVVMTANGFRVFEGSGGGATTGDDFVALTQAPNLPRGSREALMAMQRAGAGRHPFETATSPTRPRLKGMVTVEDSPPATIKR
jgi:hypothetical protein